MVNEFGSVCKVRKLKVNEAKSKLKHSARNGSVGVMHITMDGQVLEEVDQVLEEVEVSRSTAESFGGSKVL